MKALLQVMIAAICLIIMVSMPAAAQSDSPLSDTDQLRAIAVKAEAAINNGQYNDLKPLMAKNFIGTMLNQQRITTEAEFDAFIGNWFTGKEAVLRKVTMKITPDAPSLIIDGRLAVSYGHNTETYETVGGKNIVLDTRWTATLIKENGAWKILTIHCGIDFLNNPVMQTAADYWLWAGVAGLIIGLVLAWLFSLVRRFSNRNRA